ncbi:MAG TPA: hypothetical protein VGC27_04535 [Rhizomicrobium sp.]
MNVRVIAVGFAAFLLCGCSYWNSATTYFGLGPSEQSEPPLAYSAAAEPNPPPIQADQAARFDEWCQRVAKSAAEEAAGNGYDSATQQRRAAKSYQQCRENPGASMR